MDTEINSKKSARSDVKLTDTQPVLLSAAAQREDHRLTAAPKLKGGAALEVADKFNLAEGLQG